jgi:hypothetical protein
VNDCWVAQVHNQFASNHNQVMDFCPHKYSIHACQVQLISLVLSFDKTFQNDYNLKSKWRPNGLLFFFFFKVLTVGWSWRLIIACLSAKLHKTRQISGSKKITQKNPSYGGVGPYLLLTKRPTIVFPSLLLHQHLHHCRSWGPSFWNTINMILFLYRNGWNCKLCPNTYNVVNLLMLLCIVNFSGK